MVHRVEDEFDSRGNSQLVEDPKQVFFDGVLAEIEFAGDIAVAETFGGEGDNLLFAGGEHFASARVEHAERGHFRHQIEQKPHLFGIGPNLSLSHSLKTAAKQPEMRVGEGKNPAGPGSKGRYHHLALARRDEQAPLQLQDKQGEGAAR